MNKNIEKCHFYNIAKKCPFEDVGSKFVKKRGLFKYMQKPLCQFQNDLCVGIRDATASKTVDEYKSENIMMI